MGAIGKWLNPSGIGEALKKSGVFAADVALSSVLKGGDYMKAKDGINMIAESILRLQYEAFLESDEFILCKEEIDLDGIEFDIVQQVLTNVYDNSDGNDFESCWESYKVSLDRLHKAFLEFKGSNHGNENFLYWELFMKDMFPCARDFEVSVRTGNWELFLSAVERSLGIFFGTGKPNYSRYGALFYQDCLDVQRKFPALHKASEEQFLPSPLDDFFDRQSNNISYQNFFVKYCSSHYKSAKPLYLAEGLKSDPDKCTVISDGLINEAIEFRASHEEADE